MSRIGPRLRIIRRLGTPLPGLTAKEPRNPDPPGQHGATRSRRLRKSLYRVRLEEKQKVRFHYGITERQLQRAYALARKQSGRTGDVMLELLEARLDSVVFRLGFARSIPAARQLVVHGHVLVDGARVDRPAYRTSVGEMVQLAERLRSNDAVRAQVDAGPMVRMPGWLARDPDDPMRGRVVGRPDRASVPFVVDDAAIVEYYAR